LREGAITALDKTRGKVQIGGQWHSIAESTKLLRQGKPIGIDALKVGETVKFSFGRGEAGRTSIAVIHAR